MGRNQARPASGAELDFENIESTYKGIIEGGGSKPGPT